MASPADGNGIKDEINTTLTIQNNGISQVDIDPRIHASNDNQYLLIKLNDEDHFLRDYKKPWSKKQSQDDNYDTADEDDGCILQSAHYDNTDDDDDTNDQLDDGDRNSVCDPEKEKTQYNDSLLIHSGVIFQNLEYKEEADVERIICDSDLLEYDCDNEQNSGYGTRSNTYRDDFSGSDTNDDRHDIEHSASSYHKNCEIDDCNLATAVPIDSMPSCINVTDITTVSVPIVYESPDDDLFRDIVGNSHHNDIISCSINNDYINDNIPGDTYGADTSRSPSSIHSEDAARVIGKEEEEKQEFLQFKELMEGMVEKIEENECKSIVAGGSRSPSTINSEDTARINSGVLNITKDTHDVLVNNLMSSPLFPCITQSVLFKEDLFDSGNEVGDYRKPQVKNEIHEADTFNEIQMSEKEVRIGEGEIIDMGLVVIGKEEEEFMQLEELIEEIVEKIEENEGKSIVEGGDGIGKEEEEKQNFMQFQELIEEMVQRIEVDKGKSVVEVGDGFQANVKEIIYWEDFSGDIDDDRCNDDEDVNMKNDSDQNDTDSRKIILNNSNINSDNVYNDNRTVECDNYRSKDENWSENGSSDNINLRVSCEKDSTSGAYDMISPIDSQEVVDNYRCNDDEDVNMKNDSDQNDKASGQNDNINLRVSCEKDSSNGAYDMISPIDSQEVQDGALKDDIDPVNYGNVRHVVSAIKSTRGMDRGKTPNTISSTKRGGGSHIQMPHMNTTSPSFVNSVVNCTHNTTPQFICHNFEGPDSKVAFTTVYQISGSDRTLGKLWSANKHPEELIWSYLMTEDHYRKREFDIDISLRDDVSVFACNHVEKDSKGSVIMKNITDKSYACFMEVLPSPQYDIVMIVPSDGLFAKKARKHLCEFKSDFLIITCARGSCKVLLDSSILPVSSTTKTNDSKKYPLSVSTSRTAPSHASNLSHTTKLTKIDPDFESMGLYDDIDHTNNYDDESPSFNEPPHPLPCPAPVAPYRIYPSSIPASNIHPISSVNLHPNPPISAYKPNKQTQQPFTPNAGLRGIPNTTMSAVKYLIADKINIAPILNATTTPHHRPPPPIQPPTTIAPQGIRNGSSFGQQYPGIMMVQPKGNGESGMTGPSSLTSNNQITGIHYNVQDLKGSGYQGYGQEWQYPSQGQGHIYQQGQAPSNMYSQNQLQSIPPEILAELQYYRQLQQQQSQQQPYPNSNAPTYNNEPRSHEGSSRSVSKRDGVKRGRSSSTDGRNELDRGRSKRGKSRRGKRSDSSESDTESSDNKRHSSRKHYKKSRRREKSRAKSTRRSRSRRDRSKESRKEKERKHKKRKRENSEHERGREKVRERDRECKDFNDRGSAGGRSRSRMRIRSPSSDRVTAIRSHSVSNPHASHTYQASNSDRDYDRGKSVQESGRYRESSRSTSRYAGRTITTLPPDNYSHVHGKPVNNISNNSSINNNNSSGVRNHDTTLPFMSPPGLNGIGRGQHRTQPAWKSDGGLGGDYTTTSVTNNTAANAFITSIGGKMFEKNEGENMNNAKVRGPIGASRTEEGEETELSVLVQAPNITSNNNSDVSPMIRDVSSELAIQAKIREKNLKKLALSQGKR